MGGPEDLWTGNQPAFPDIGGYGNHEYGNRVGIFPILAVLDKYGIKPTLALDKAIGDHYPFLVREGLEPPSRLSILAAALRSGTVSRSQTITLRCTISRRLLRVAC
jgi:hypothetical protein